MRASLPAEAAGVKPAECRILSRAAAHDILGEMRSQPLDILRGMAILLVLGRHADFLVPGREGTLPTMFQPLLRGGWVGVDLFFVLSGFLVSGLLFREYLAKGDIWVGRFLVRRGFKIYPAFHAFLLAMFLGALAVGQSLDWRPLLCEALFVQNYGQHLFPHTWSLAVEEHFYLLMCLCFALCLRWRRRRPFVAVPFLFAILASACLLMRLVMARYPYTHETHTFPTHLRMDALMFGVLLSYFYHFKQDGLARLVGHRSLLLLIMGFGLVLPCFLLELETSVYVHTIGLTLNYLGWGCVLLAAIFWRPAPSRWLQGARSLMASIGFYSYSIYVWHVFVRDLVLLASLGLERKGVRLHYGVEFSLYILGALLIGTLMARTIETPFLRFRDRWFPSRSKAETYVLTGPPLGGPFTSKS